MVKVAKSNNTAKIQNIEIHERRSNNEQTWQTKIHRTAVELASTFVGQAIMMQFEKILWTLEKTATWISNGKTDGKRAKTPAVLVRPLPWVFFLPALVLMRYTRVMLSLISICCGFDEIEASTMVAFLHQSRRNVHQINNQAARNRINETQQCSTIAYVNQFFLSVLSNLCKLISCTSDPAKVHSNKTSLNTTETGGGVKLNDNKFSDDSDSDDQAYQDFLSRTLPDAEDTDDEDYVYEMNGEDTSDTDSQSSVATEDLSDDEHQKPTDIAVEQRQEKGTNGDNNHSADTTNNQTDNAKTYESSHDDAQSSTSHASDDALNRLIESAAVASTKTTETKNGNRGKANINRHHKNGRFHTKHQNNGQHLNGAHSQAKSETTKQQQQQQQQQQQHVKSTTDFIVEATTADRT